MDQKVNVTDKEQFATLPKNIGLVDHKSPMTAEEYIEELDDGREVYIYGERVKKVTEHPAFRNTARMTARLFDALHNPKHSKKILLPTEDPHNQDLLYPPEIFYFLFLRVVEQT